MGSSGLIIIVLLSILIIGAAIILLRLSKGYSQQISEEINSNLNNRFLDNRREVSQLIREGREELSNGMQGMASGFDQKFHLLSESLSKDQYRTRTDLVENLRNFKISITNGIESFKKSQHERFNDLVLQHEKLLVSTENKLEKMRETVDEKLHKTLEERLGQSFKMVSDRLEAVQKGLGEMHHLAAGVGDLKKVLSNVKTRGVLGEIQLGSILEQLLSPEQYDQNVKTSSKYDGFVEYAIKMPGKNKSDWVYLPIDAKFPLEDYVRLQEAYENGDVHLVNRSKKSLVISVKKFAQEIRDKYLDVPQTTDFGIMFLPIEGLYAELVRYPDLVALLQRDYQIAITGPTTLSAFLNSLQMGFRTLAIQSRSSDIQKTLEAVKTQFGLFGEALRKAQDRIKRADKELENLVTTRTNVMFSKLKDIDTLSLSDSEELLEITPNVSRKERTT